MLRLCPYFVFFAALVFASCQKNAPAQSSSASALPPITDETDASGAPIRKPNPWKNHGCDLITDDDIKTLFGVDRARDVLNARSLPDQAFCLRTWNKPDWKERETANEKDGATTYLNPQNRLVVQVFGYGTVLTAKEQFAMLRRDRRSTYEEDVPNLGDEALWSTSTVTLLVRRGHLVLNLALEYSDTPHDNLAKAKEVAQLALPRIWNPTNAGSLTAQ